MSITEAAPQTDLDDLPDHGIVNDFAFVAATINGSGSQTANNVLIRAIFSMGVPVCGKNLFPSNIQGLPTWYTVRVSKDGYTARRETTEILIAFNPQTAAEDVRNLPSGGVCIHPDDMVFAEQRDDVIFYPIPVKALIKQANLDAKIRDYVANMAYVGAVAQLLGIDMEEIRNALKRHFNNKPKPVALNFDMVTAAANWTRDNLVKRDRFSVRPMNETNGLMLIDGNTAGALGALMGGMTVTAWYPITPSTSLVDAMNEYAPRLRLDPATGEPTFAIVQAEDELAAAGIIVGAGWCGARAMTATSGPGISLMSEFAGMAYLTEIPCVIWDIQRMGPSTGLPTRVSQGDVLPAYTLGHGDTRHIVLLPGGMEECFTFAQDAFDLAERLQTIVFVLSDLDLGMNNWMSRPFTYPEKPLDRGKVLSAEQLDAIERWGRYQDVDGDGIPWRTIPGTNHPRAGYFARGTGHNDFAQYSERPEDWQGNLDRLTRKHETARTLVPKPVIDNRTGARIGIIAYGSTCPAVEEARDGLRKRGIETSFARLRALPLTQEIRDFIKAHERIYVVDMNHEGQMHQLLQLDMPADATRLFSVHLCNGLPLTAKFVAESLLAQEGISL